MQLTKGQRELVAFLHESYMSYSIDELVTYLNFKNPKARYTRSMISSRVKRLLNREIVRRGIVNKTYYYTLTPHARRAYESDIR